MLMKQRGRHREKVLTAVQVRQLKEPGRYADGNGLYLVVDPTGAKRWLLRTVVQGRRRDIGLGGVALVSLSEAREQALAYRKLARSGGDPLAQRQKEQVVQKPLTFEEAAIEVHEAHRASWKNAKHAAQWLSTLQQYVFPDIGNVPIAQVDTPDILRVLTPIWLTKPETARRVRQRIGAVLDWARAAGHRDGENPVRGVAKGLPKQTQQVRHHEALPYAKVPEFILQLRKADASPFAKLAFEFLILTATRTSETLGARWSEIDRDQRVWTIPAVRMKAGKPHRVPLSGRALEILADARRFDVTSEYVFPGRKSGAPLSNMALAMILRRLGSTVTVHGFRSSFRDWAAEATNYPREVAEMALAHTIENDVEAAYRRGDLLEKRREMMEGWAQKCKETKETKGK